MFLKHITGNHFDGSYIEEVGSIGTLGSTMAFNIAKHLCQTTPVMFIRVQGVMRGKRAETHLKPVFRAQTYGSGPVP